MRYILIPITNDNVREETEEFTVQLSLPDNTTGVVLEVDMAVVRILDDDRKHNYDYHNNESD